MKGLRVLGNGFIALAVLYAVPSHAVCFYPHSTLSGYHVPLESEIKSSTAIIIGKVVHVQYVPPAPGVPDAVNTFLYTVERLHQIKGHVPVRVLLSSTNDSGGYRMALGETDLLFLTPQGHNFTADVCGNSTELPKGDYVVSRVRKLLGAQP